jgi:phosphotransferase system enzyme I (PtsP)
MNERKATLESSLLLTLKETSQLVAHSHDPGETLANIVRLIQKRFHTDVCSVYVLEPDTLSVAVGRLAATRQALDNVLADAIARLADDLVRAGTAADVRSILRLESGSYDHRSA